MAFRFRLAKVLGLREHAEQDAARELARRQGLVNACRLELDRMARSREELLARRDSLQQGRVLPPLLGENRYQLIVLERATDLTERKLAGLEREAEAARRELMERSKERRLLEKLRDRRREEYELEERRRELREQDARPQPRHGMAIAMQKR